jgi:hypothetical protein
MDYISGFFGYFYSVKQDVKEEEDSVCNLESTLTPNCLNELPENKFINAKVDLIDNK